MQHEVPASLVETTFVGRSDLLQLLLDLVRTGTHRLVTLVGPGGVGKTRLAVEFAREATAELGVRVAFVRLGRVRNAGLFGTALEEALGIGQATGSAPLDQCIEVLSTGRWLLVIDNFEHLRAATPDLEYVIDACPNVALVVTSRVALGIGGEHLVPVPPLTSGILGDGDPAAFPAVRLFADRARLSVPGFIVTSDNSAEIATLCDRLGGLPLAIQLAASRTALFSPRDLLRFDGPLLAAVEPATAGGDRQSTISNTIAWSLDLVSLEARDALIQLSVLDGDFPFPIAAALTACSHAQLGELVDYHLIDPLEGVNGERRFTMHEIIRQYGHERLVLSGRLDAVQQRMVEVMLARVLPFATSLPDSATLLGIDADLPMIRAALSCAIDRGHLVVASNLFAGLEQYWVRRTRRDEVLYWTERILAALAARGGGGRDPAFGSASRVAGTVLLHDGQFDRSRTLLEDAIRYAEDSGDARAIATALLSAAAHDNQIGDFEAANRRLVLALQIVPEGTDSVLIGRIHSGLGVAALFSEDLDRAERHLIRALEVLRTVGDTEGVAGNLHYLGYTVAFGGDYERARLYTGEAIAILEPFPSRHRTWMIQARAWVELLSGNPVDAAPYLAETLRMRYDLGETRILHFTLHDTARALLMMGEPASSAWFLGAGNGKKEVTDRLTPFSRPTVETYNATLGALGEREFRRQYNAGAAASLDDVVHTALAHLERLASANDAAPDPYGLTSRERDVLALIVNGRSDTDIAGALFISRDTAKTHARNILRKLGVSSRVAAVAVAHREKLVPLDE